jgi:feruloyl esterase
MKLRHLLVLLAMFAMAGIREARAQLPEAAAQRCAALAGADFGALPDAPTQVLAAKAVAAAGDVPAYCMVQGYVTPNVGFELRLPQDGWNGKFIHQGCGGWCGSLSHALACDGVVRRGYACVVTDMGHKSTALDGKWAYNNLQAEVDFGFRATHVTTLAGKAITAAYYGSAPKRAYFTGCSTGGRQGLLEAQRFPYDFDGIVSGAPVVDETGDAVVLLWAVKSLHDANGKALLGSRELRQVHEAVIARCDLNDGVRDGLIGDPRACDFDPHTLACSHPGAPQQCLSDVQADAVAAVYAGPRDSAGRPISIAHAYPGSELNWINNYVRDGGQPSIYAGFMTEMFRYLNFSPDPGPGWQMNQFDWDRDYRRIAVMEMLYNAQNPDLRKFKAAGGKIIAYQGWADQSVLPSWVIDYYETAERTMGGRAATQDFFRLFTLPGVNHCVGGEGADQVDYLGYLDAWVEQGKAPDSLLAAHIDVEPGLAAFLVRHPIDPARVVFSRPLFPYPLRTVYSGKGDPAAAASYKAKAPR